MFISYLSKIWIDIYIYIYYTYIYIVLFLERLPILQGT